MSNPRVSQVVVTKKNEDDQKVSGFDQWISSIYDIQDFDQEELSQYYEALRYHGFDRKKVLIRLYEKVKDKKIVMQLVLLCALQGPNRASQTKLSNGQSPSEMGIPSSGQQKTENISCARITAATADLAAFYLKRLNAPKKFPTHACPSYLQFPSAGSIIMSDELRQLHIDFAKKFSIQIGGVFNEGIYGQMIANAYLDPKLKLFDM
jgi:hypothetical protein